MSSLLWLSWLLLSNSKHSHLYILNLWFHVITKASIFLKKIYWSIVDLKCSISFRCIAFQVISSWFGACHREEVVAGKECSQLFCLSLLLLSQDFWLFWERGEGLGARMSYLTSQKQRDNTYNWQRIIIQIHIFNSWERTNTY